MVLLSGTHGFHEKTQLIQSHLPQLLGFPVSSVVKRKKKIHCQCRRDEVRFLGQEGPLEKETATHSNIAWEIPWIEEPSGAIVQGVAKSQTRLSNDNDNTTPTSASLCFSQASVCTCCIHTVTAKVHRWPQNFPLLTWAFCKLNPKANVYLPKHCKASKLRVRS